ncbi:MAG TPA: HRDC domain-containing protein [Rhodanobacteraceae bacterium]
MTESACPAATWITTQADLQTWFEPVADGDIVGVDTEFTRRSTFYPQLSLLQLGHRGRYALVDPLAFELGDILERQLGQRPVTTVMHSAGEDLETLAPWLPHGPATLFDTQIATAFSGGDMGAGYGALVKQWCGVELDKGETRSDWNQRPLTPSQIHYATLDVVYLEPLYRALSERLAQGRHEDWFRADCIRLEQRADRATAPDQPQTELHAAADRPPAQQALLRRLLLWRETTARRIDKPRTWLIDNHQALDLVLHPPTDMNALMQATRGQRALRGPQRHALLELLQMPVTDADIAATTPVAGRPDRSAKTTVQAMKSSVDDLARELNLPPGLLCPRKAIEAFIATGQWPGHLSGWRDTLLHARLAALLPR